MQYLTSIIMITLIISNSKAQENDTIYWNSKTKLKWSDFNFNIADTCYKNHAAAMTASGTYWKSFNGDKLPNYIIRAYFLKSESCAIDTSSLIKLSHEQFHFDIEELYARRMRKIVADLREKGVSNIAVYKSYLKKLSIEVELYQDKYDFETSHGNMDSIQIQWEEKVKKELKELKAYSNDNKKK